jgi:hypothetical protein
MTQQGSWALLPINDASNLLRKVTIWKGPEKKKKTKENNYISEWRNKFTFASWVYRDTSI